MNTNPHVSIIILNYNGKHYLADCIRSVLSQKTKKTFEVIVVDNASTDNSLQEIQTQEAFSTIRTLALPSNLGFAKANNSATEIASGTYLVFLNNDTIVDPHWLEELIKPLEENDTIGLSTPKVLLANSDPVKVQNAGIAVFSEGFARDRGAVVGSGIEDYEIDSEYFENSQEVHAACGVSLCIRKKLFDRLGGFDEGYFMYYEDVDLSLRARLLGYGVMYCPKATLRHMHAASSKVASPFFIKHTEYSHLYFVLSFFPLTTIVQTFFLHALFIVSAFRGMVLGTGTASVMGIRIQLLLKAVLYLPFVVSKRFFRKQKYSFATLYATFY